MLANSPDKARRNGMCICAIRKRNSPKVSGLKTRRTRLVDMERVLEMLVQRVEQAITESPEEKQDGDKRERKD